MLSPELLKKVESLYIRSRRSVTDVFVGEYESAFRGQGIEFEEFREYVPGDDIRQIDWNVSARMDRPYLKVFREEREQTIFFLVDASASLDFGGQRSKRETLTEIAGLLSYAASKSHDKTGLIIFSDRIEVYIPPKKGTAHVWNLIAKILTHRPSGKKTRIAAAVQFFLNVAHRRSLCFLLSDFHDADYHTALSVGQYRHEFIAVRVTDPVERCLPAACLVDFEDLEEGAVLRADLGGLAARRLSARQGQEFAALTRFLRGHQIDFLDVSTAEDHVEALKRLFLRRELRRL